MTTSPGANVVTKPGSKAKSSKKTAASVSANLSPATDLATRLDENRIRERAYGIWIEEGRRNGRELAHWRRAHHEVQREA